MTSASRRLVRWLAPSHHVSRSVRHGAPLALAALASACSGDQLAPTAAPPPGPPSAAIAPAATQATSLITLLLPPPGAPVLAVGVLRLTINAQPGDPCSPAPATGVGAAPVTACGFIFTPGGAAIQGLALYQGTTRVAGLAVDVIRRS